MSTLGANVVVTLERVSKKLLVLEVHLVITMGLGSHYFRYTALRTKSGIDKVS